MPMQTAATTQEGASAESTADRLRAEQSASFQAEEFGRFFTCTRRLAEVSPGYARSYEFYVHCVLHALAHRKPDLFFLQIGGMDGKPVRSDLRLHQALPVEASSWSLYQICSRHSRRIMPAARAWPWSTPL
jgi:hypothetical protein